MFLPSPTSFNLLAIPSQTKVLELGWVFLGGLFFVSVFFSVWTRRRLRCRRCDTHTRASWNPKAPLIREEYKDTRNTNALGSPSDDIDGSRHVIAVILLVFRHLMSLSQQAGEAGEAIRPRSRCDLISFIYKQTNKPTNKPNPKWTWCECFSFSEVKRTSTRTTFIVITIFIASFITRLLLFIWLHRGDFLRRRYRRVYFLPNSKERKSLVPRWSQQATVAGFRCARSKVLRSNVAFCLRLFQ